MFTVHFYIVSEDSGKVLDAQGSNNSVVINELHGGPSQQWIIHKNGTIESVAYIGNVLNINGAEKQNRAKLCLFPLNGNDNQLFTIDRKGHIYIKHSGKVLDVEQAKRSNGTAVLQYDFHGRSNQKWRLAPVYDFYQQQQQGYPSGGSWNRIPQPNAPPPQQQSYEPMNDLTFQGLLRAIQQESFDSGRNNVISTAAAYNYFTCTQLARIFNALSFSSQKIFAAQAICPKIVDKQNMHIVLSALTFENEKEKVARFFRQ